MHPLRQHQSILDRQHMNAKSGLAQYARARTKTTNDAAIGVDTSRVVGRSAHRSTVTFKSALALARKREQMLVSLLGVRPPVRLLSVALTPQGLREPTVALHEAGRYIRAGVTAFTLRTPLRPNHSVELRANGVAHWPSSAGPAAHLALAVQRATPSSPAHLKR